MSQEIKIDVKINQLIDSTETVITGFVGFREVMVVSNYNKKWSVGLSSTLPVNMGKAQKYIDCMNLVFSEAEKHGYKKENSAHD